MVLAVMRFADSIVYCQSVIHHHIHSKVPYLKYRHIILPVDLIGRGVEPVALLHVLVEDAATLHVAQAELTQVKLR